MLIQICNGDLQEVYYFLHRIFSLLKKLVGYSKQMRISGSSIVTKTVIASG